MSQVKSDEISGQIRKLPWGDMSVWYADMNRGWSRNPGRWPYYKGDRIPLDPWGQKYQYLIPGRYNPASFDIWSFHGHSRDQKLWIGNWKSDKKDS